MSTGGHRLLHGTSVELEPGHPFLQPMAYREKTGGNFLRPNFSRADALCINVHANSLSHTHAKSHSHVHAVVVDMLPRSYHTVQHGVYHPGRCKSDRGVNHSGDETLESPKQPHDLSTGYVAYHTPCGVMPDIGMASRKRLPPRNEGRTRQQP